jgi:hypothetical protein
MISIEKYQGLRNFGKMKPNGHGSDFWYCASIESQNVILYGVGAVQINIQVVKSDFVEVMSALLLM